MAHTPMPTPVLDGRSSSSDGTEDSCCVMNLSAAALSSAAAPAAFMLRSWASGVLVGVGEPRGACGEDSGPRGDTDPPSESASLRSHRSRKERSPSSPGTGKGQTKNKLMAVRRPNQQGNTSPADLAPPAPPSAESCSSSSFILELMSDGPAGGTKGGARQQMQRPAPHTPR